MNFDYPEGATPIDPDEAQGLLLPHIRTMAELDRWEQENIIEAENSVFKRRQKDILTEKYVRSLHKKMFGNVWRWAGDFRYRYIEALQAADRHDYEPLLTFVRS